MKKEVERMRGKIREMLRRKERKLKGLVSYGSGFPQNLVRLFAVSCGHRNGPGARDPSKNSETVTVLSEWPRSRN